MSVYRDISPETMKRAEQLHEEMQCPHGKGSDPFDDLDIAAALLMQALEPMADETRRRVIQRLAEQKKP